MADLHRRAVLTGAASAAMALVAGSARAGQPFWLPSSPEPAPYGYGAGTGGLYPEPMQPSMRGRRPPATGGGLYGPVAGEPFPVPGLKPSIVPEAFHRTVVAYDSGEAPGTILVDPRSHYLYFINGDGSAIRYGVGVGRSGFGWSGVANVRTKQAWPDWYPPKEMLERQPDLAAKMQDLQSGIGMPGGPGNPLGARALYLWQGNKDTLYRIHGTVEPWTIGKSVSSGCIRMINQDVIDLYDRVPVGAKVIVAGSATPTAKVRRRRRDDDIDDAAL
jgi:lipoprotein-anchoring transpeptidase ErfK/SrfK